MTEIDWAALQGAAKGQLDPIPPGQYLCKVIDAQATQTQTGKPMFKVKFEVAEGPQSPRKVWNNFTVSEENPMALAIFFRQMEAMGLNANFFASKPSNAQVAQALMNRQCMLTLGTRTWQGVEQNSVTGVAPPQGGGPIAPGVATGPATPLPTAGASPLPTAAPAATPMATPTSPTTPPTPTDAPPPLPI
jgi:hypothetical protein